MSLLLLYVAPKKRTGGTMVGVRPVDDDEILIIWEANQAATNDKEED